MATGSHKMSLFLTDEANDFMQALADDTRAAAARHGYTLEIAFADNQAVQQIQQIYAALHGPEHERPEAVRVVPVHDTILERVARSSVAAGVAWMCLHRATGDLEAVRAAFPEVPAALVTPDHEEIGRLQGQQLIALLKHGGRVLYLQGRSGNSSVPRRAAGLREAIRGSGIEIGDTIDGNWSVAETEQAVTRWLRLMIRHTTVHAVVCQNDAMAIGVRRAFQTVADRPDLMTLPVIGCDGLAHVGRALVDKRELAATVVLPLSGSVAVDLLVTAKNSGEQPPCEVVLTPQPYPARPAMRTPSNTAVA